MTYRSERLEPGRHDISKFSCGARTWVWIDKQVEVVGPYALTAHKVAREKVLTKVGRGGPTEIPAVLLARLALSSSRRGQGLDQVLVADALARVVDATQTVGARLVVVDALHEVVIRFYESLGFRRVPGSILVVPKIADIEAALVRPD